MNYIICDISTAPLENAARFLSDEDFAAPSNYGPDAAAKFIANAKAKAIEQCALDPDLCRLSGICMAGEDGTYKPWTFGDLTGQEPDGFDFETDILQNVQARLESGDKLISFNGLKFDWPVLNARARYLGVKLNISLEKYRNDHVDLYARLTNHGSLKGHSLRWWVRRHGWSDIQKPLEGAEEAKVFETKRWAELADSLCHDVEATRRLATWAGIL